MYCNLRQVLACFVILAGCSRHSASGPARIAVLRFENLTPDVSLDWMGRAASEIISLELSGGKSAVISPTAIHANPLAQQRPASTPGESAERSAAIAEGATRIVMGQISRVGNRLMVDVTERDPATGTTLDNFTLTPRDANDLYSLADGVAHRISPQAAPFETRNNQAIAAWARAMEESEYAKLAEDYSSAVRADPQFASAWLAWASAAARHGDREGAAEILVRAQQHAGGFSELNRARIKLASVELTGDRAAVLAALNNLGRLDPDDPSVVRAVADGNYRAKRYPAAIAAYRRLTQLIPDSGAAWNQLGYALLAAGDYDGAMSALQTYQRLFPNDANPYDSQGDVAFAFGRFPEAEKLYEQENAKDPAFNNSVALYKAAYAVLMTGDIAAADKNFAAWATIRQAAKDPTVAIRTAQWSFIAGRHQQAIASLARIAASPEVAQLKPLALTQMAIWDLQLGQRERALRESGEALKSGGASASTITARFASEDLHAVPDWSTRADSMLGAPQLAQVKPMALAYALYFTHQWEAAAPVWKRLVDLAPPDDSITPAIYGQILVELKRPRDAEPYVRQFPIPSLQSMQEFLSLAIPEIFQVRAEALAAQGKTGEADAARKVFQALWGKTLGRE